LHSSTYYTNQELYKKHLVIKVDTIKITDDFGYAKEAHHVYHQIDAFYVSKDKWNTNEDTGKSLKNALYVLRYAKRHLLG